jgi:hypothetical protein
MNSDASLNADETEWVLRQRIKELEALLGHEWLAPSVVKLTPSEERVLAVIVAQHPKFVVASKVYDIIYSSRLDPPEPAIVLVLAHKMRRKLDPFGIKVEHKAERGYAISPENLERLNALYVEGERA